MRKSHSRSSYFDVQSNVNVIIKCHVRGIEQGIVFFDEVGDASFIDQPKGSIFSHKWSSSHIPYGR